MENQQQAPVLSTKDWVITLLIRLIPIVGLVMLFVWAFGSSENPNKTNWAKAMLIMMVIGIVLACIFFALFWGAIAALIMSGGGMQNYE
jgi:nucleoside permease NupC